MTLATDAKHAGQRGPLGATPNVLLVATVALPHVGWSLIEAARELGVAMECLDQQRAYQAPGFVRRVCWWLFQRRPPRLRRFGREVCQRVRQGHMDCILTTGCAPLDVVTVKRLRDTGSRVLNFSTDDPWNPSLSGNWFRRTLPHYSTVFTPRRANMENFKQAGCEDVRYLPFAYDPRLHFIENALPADMTSDCDVVFVGGADEDRLPWVRALIAAGLDVDLWGGYWQGKNEFRSHARGHTDGPAALRRVTRTARVVLCLVRRANRDGHAMRTFEVPAMGGCMLVEDTEEHREILGADGECAVFFRSEQELVAKARWLLAHPEERNRLSRAAHLRVTRGQNTYLDRLRTMLEV